MSHDSQKSQEYFGDNYHRIKAHFRRVDFVEDVQCFVSDQKAYLHIILTSLYNGDHLTNVTAQIEEALMSFDVRDNCSGTLKDMFGFLVVQEVSPYSGRYRVLS